MKIDVRVYSIVLKRRKLANKTNTFPDQMLAQTSNETNSSLLRKLFEKSKCRQNQVSNIEKLRCRYIEIHERCRGDRH